MQTTAYELRISDWSSDVCFSDLDTPGRRGGPPGQACAARRCLQFGVMDRSRSGITRELHVRRQEAHVVGLADRDAKPAQNCICGGDVEVEVRHEVIACVLASRESSEEHTSELQSLMRHSYAVFCLKKQK